MQFLGKDSIEYNNTLKIRPSDHDKALAGEVCVICIYVYICTHTNTHTHTLYIYIYIHTHTHTHTHTLYTHTHTDTHTHTHTHPDTAVMKQASEDAAFEPSLKPSKDMATPVFSPATGQPLQPMSVSHYGNVVPTANDNVFVGPVVEVGGAHSA